MVNLIVIGGYMIEEYNLQREELKFFPFNFYIRKKSKKSNN